MNLDIVPVATRKRVIDDDITCVTWQLDKLVNYGNWLLDVTQQQMSGSQILLIKGFILGHNDIGLSLFNKFNLQTRLYLGEVDIQDAHVISLISTEQKQSVIDFD